MKFFYADSLDLVDPAFDFMSETSLPTRVPQRDDVYAHEFYAPWRPYDGILVSKSLVDGGGQGRYTQPQRQRFHREGAQRFLRFPANGQWDPMNFPILGDCGAFNYHKQQVPPYSVEEVLEFYDRCGFTHGVSVDHMILDYDERYDNFGMLAPAEYQRRADLTLELGSEFLERCRASKLRLTPLGAAQGWSPRSYKRSVEALIKQGYDYVALGGLVPLKTRDILAVLGEVGPVARGKARLHLLGITRIENFERFRNAGVVSLDSTSPLRQAFKDSTDNYYSDSGHYQALRIPQADVYPKVVRRIREGVVAQEIAVAAERRCLDVVREFDQDRATVDDVVNALTTYEDLYGGKSRWDQIRRTLSDAPWRRCDCAVCRRLGIDVIIFRGANRNRRRGFHNLWYVHQKLLDLPERGPGVRVVTMIEFPALALQQPPNKTIYSFGLDGKTIGQFATVARAGRSDGGQFIGYQRPEVRRHVAEIRRYLESGAPMVPNAVVLAFDSRVQFRRIGPLVPGFVQRGVLRVPRKRNPDDEAVAWIVDGQQRLAAIREANVQAFPIFAIAFIAKTIEEQREQFLLVNSTKPLPRALIHELLPGVSQNLPTYLAKRQVPATIVAALNSHPSSPLFGAIATATNPSGRLKDNSMLRVLESSLSDGVLYRISRSALTEDGKRKITLRVLHSFWNAVKDTWPDIWELGPRKSRLLHGAGVVTLGFLMDAMSDRRRDDWPDYDFFYGELAKVKPYCRWNEGYWEFGPDHHRHWNEIQNTPKDVQLLANYLNRLYLRTWASG